MQWNSTPSSWRVKCPIMAWRVVMHSVRAHPRQWFGSKFHLASALKGLFLKISMQLFVRIEETMKFYVSWSSNMSWILKCNAIYSKKCKSYAQVLIKMLAWWTLRGSFANPWSLWVEDKCIQECGAEKDNEEWKYLLTLELEECNALGVDKIDVN